MPIADLCQRGVAMIEPDATVNLAARLMREQHVGDVVVCRRKGDRQGPLGILTDRDIVVGLVAKDIPANSVRVDDVMTPTLITVPEHSGVYETIQLMERYGVRRVPVVDKHGGLLGIVSSGDLLGLLSEEILSISKLPERQARKEREVRI